MKKCLLFAFVCLFLSTATGVGYADPWADEVAGYEMGTGVYSIYPNWTSDPKIDHGYPGNALGMPDYVDDRTGGYTSLGWGGSIVLKFTDNYLTTSGNTDKDLWIYEIGDKLEPVEVYISQTNGNWISVGTAAGGKYGIDIDAYCASGVIPWEAYTYVRLVDMTPLDAGPNDPRYSYSPWAGADIDAVETCSTRPPVPTPEPGILLMLGTGLVACTGLRKKRK